MTALSYVLRKLAEREDERKLPNCGRGCTGLDRTEGRCKCMEQDEHDHS